MYNDDKLLIVDDDKPTRMLVLRVAEALKFRFVMKAADGLEAIERRGETKLDIRVWDCSMPNMGGLEVLRFLKEQNILKEMA